MSHIGKILRTWDEFAGLIANHLSLLLPHHCSSVNAHFHLVIVHIVLPGTWILSLLGIEHNWSFSFSELTNLRLLFRNFIHFKLIVPPNTVHCREVLIKISSILPIEILYFFILSVLPNRKILLHLWIKNAHQNIFARAWSRLPSSFQSLHAAVFSLTSNINSFTCWEPEIVSFYYYFIAGVLLPTADEY